MLKSRILSIFNKITPLVDIGIFYYLFSYLNAQEHILFKIFSYVCIAGIIFVLYRWGRAMYLVVKSKKEVSEYLLANRVIPICGKQRVGKSSLASYFAQVVRENVYSNIPLRVNGKYTYKLNSDILTCRKQIPDLSLLIVDEANLFYNNIHSDKEDSNIFGQAVLCQCVGHFFDGNVLYVSVDVERLPKQIRDVYSAKLQVTASESYRYSLLGDLLLRVSAKIFLRDERIFTGLRVWKAQHYEFIHQEQYISLLGNKDNEFSPMLTFCAFQNFGLSTYDDRYMKAYYKDKPHNQNDRWNSLILNKEDFEQLYDGAVIAYLNNLKKEEEQKQKKIRIIDPNEKGSTE